MLKRTRLDLGKYGITLTREGNPPHKVNIGNPQYRSPLSWEGLPKLPLDLGSKVPELKGQDDARSHATALIPSSKFKRSRKAEKQRKTRSQNSRDLPAHRMIDQERQGGAPHGILLAVVVALVLLVPSLVGERGEAITAAIAELLSPVGLLLLPIVLLLTIQFLSSERGSFISSMFSTGEPDTIHRVSGSPVGVALVLIVILFLLYNRVSIFGGGDDSGE